MQVALVISLVALLLVAASATVAVQDQHTKHHEAKRRQTRLARLGEPTPRLAAYAAAQHHRWFGR